MRMPGRYFHQNRIINSYPTAPASVFRSPAQREIIALCPTWANHIRGEGKRGGRVLFFLAKIPSHSLFYHNFIILILYFTQLCRPVAFVLFRVVLCCCLCIWFGPPTLPTCTLNPASRDSLNQDDTSIRFHHQLTPLCYCFPSCEFWRLTKTWFFVFFLYVQKASTPKNKDTPVGRRVGRGGKGTQNFH